MVSRIFIYGTLRRGSSAAYCKMAEPLYDTCLTDCKLYGHRLARVNGATYPTVTDRSEPGNYVTGHVVGGHKVERFEALLELCDEIEGYPTLYTRKVVDVVVGDTDLEVVKAYVYQYVEQEDVVPIDGHTWPLS